MSDQEKFKETIEVFGLVGQGRSCNSFYVGFLSESSCNGGIDLLIIGLIINDNTNDNGTKNTKRHTGRLGCRSVVSVTTQKGPFVYGYTTRPVRVCDFRRIGTSRLT